MLYTPINDTKKGLYTPTNTGKKSIYTPINETVNDNTVVPDTIPAKNSLIPAKTTPVKNTDPLNFSGFKDKNGKAIQIKDYTPEQKRAMDENNRLIQEKASMADAYSQSLHESVPFLFVGGLPEATADTAKAIGQGVARTVGTVGITAGNVPTKIANAITKPLGMGESPMPFDSVIPTKGNKVANALFGGEPIRDLGNASQNAKEKANALASRIVGHPVAPVGDIGGLGFAVGGIVMDLSGMGGGKAVNTATDVVPEAFLKFLAKEKNPAVIEATLKKVGVDPVNSSSLAEKLAPVKTKNEVKDILANHGSNELNAPPESTGPIYTPINEPKALPKPGQTIDTSLSPAEILAKAEADASHLGVTKPIVGETPSLFSKATQNTPPIAPITPATPTTQQTRSTPKLYKNIYPTETPAPQVFTPPVPSAPAPIVIDSLDSYKTAMENFHTGTGTVGDYQYAFKTFQDNLDKIKTELNSLSKAELTKKYGGYTVRASDTKASIVDTALSNLKMGFTLSRGLSYSPFENGGSSGALQKLVENTNQGDIIAHSERVMKARADNKARYEAVTKAISDPKTLADYKTFIEYKGEKNLTPEQRVVYDELLTLNAKEARAKAREASGVVSGVKANTEMTQDEITHSKTGEKLYRVKMQDRVDKELYITLNQSAKKLGGHYSTFSRGFLFKNKESADQFISVSKGETVTTNRPQERLAQRKNDTAEKLTQMADSIEAKGTESLNADRKVNTARRARQASHSEANAQNDIALAKTMRNLADAIESGKAVHLDGLTTKTQIEELDTILRRAKYKEDNANKVPYSDNGHTPITEKTVEFVNEIPDSMNTRSLIEILNKGIATPGAKQLSQSLLKVVDASKDLFTPNTFQMKKIVELVDKINLDNYNPIKHSVVSYKRLVSMGIETTPQLRTALREYIKFKEAPKEADKTKMLERDLIGQKGVGIDFFPTPKSVAEKMVELADIKEGMTVLEPSAGNGNIAEVIRASGVEPDVAEISSQLRGVLESKGFKVVENDFMAVTKKYDRIIMNPPFSNNMDIQHVEHAYSLLNPGGKIVSIMGEGAFFRAGKRETTFRDWLDKQGAVVDVLPENTFKDANLLATTGANARMIEISKPEAVNSLIPVKTPKTQKEKVAEAVKENPLSIKQVAEQTKILEPNVRRILGMGAKDGTFERVSEGIYVLKTKNGNYAYVEMGDAETSLSRMVSEGKTFDSVILDPAYFSRALIGGNRGIKDWGFIMPEQFAKVMQSISKLMAQPDSHVYLMLSGARTAQIDMEKYVSGATDAGFKVVGEGGYQKTFQDGSPVTNARGQVANPERMILMTQSGTAREGDIPVSLDFRFIRPSIAKSYQTEKPAELMKALIEQSTLQGETVLDPFAGSGVTGAEALKAGRNSVSIEKLPSTVENYTKPRIEATAKEINATTEVTKQPELAIEAKKYSNVEDFIKAQGKPMYHGTLSTFDNFDMKKAGSNSGWDNAKFGTFFLENKDEAMKFPELTRENNDTRPVTVKEAYLNIKNPIDLTMQGIFNNESQAPTLLKIFGTESGEPITDPAKALEYINENIDMGDIPEMYDTIYSDIKNKKIMQKAGYDGITAQYGTSDNGSILEHVAFSPEQIKTRTQLEDIFKQAHGTKEVAPIPKKDPATPEQLQRMIAREKESLAHAQANPEAHAKAYGPNRPDKYKARITQLKTRLEAITPAKPMVPALIPKKVMVPKTDIQLPNDLQMEQTRIELKKAYLQEEISNSPGKLLQKLINKKEGGILDPRDITKYYHTDMARYVRLKAQQDKKLRIAEHAFEGTKYADVYDDPDIQRQELERYQNMREEMKQLHRDTKELNIKIKAHENAVKDEMALNILADKAGKITDIPQLKEYNARKKLSIINAVEKKLRSEGYNRSQQIRIIRKHFNLTDGEFREVMKGTPDYKTMTESDFQSLLTRIEGKAFEVQLRSEARMQLEATIADKELRKVENLQQAMKMPSLKNMTTEQIHQFDDLLNTFKRGDEFLGVRQLETVKNTDLSGIHTKREALENLAKRTGVSVEQLNTIKMTESDRWLYDSALSRRNPFYRQMVEDSSRATIEASLRAYEFKKKLNELINKARNTRKRGFLQKAIPTDNMIFDYIEATPEDKLSFAKDMTPAEIEVAHFIQDKYSEIRDYLATNNAMENFRGNYITHVRRSFLEAWRETGKFRGIWSAFKEMLDSFKQDEAVFNILNQKTKEVLPLEKFFKFSMHRSGELVPTKNVAKAVLEYITAFEKKRALDSLIPKIDIYAHSLTPTKMTPRGLEFDDSLKRFVKEWLNTKKGRATELMVKPGGQIDWALRSGVALTRLLDLGLNIPVGLASHVGEQAGTFVSIGTKRYTTGLARSLTPQGRAIAKKYGSFVGETLVERIREASKNLGDKVGETVFGLFSSASRMGSVVHLLGSMTPEEYKSGIVSVEKLAEIHQEMNRWRTVEGDTSVIGKTAEGSVLKQYKSWAVPILHTTQSNLSKVIGMIKDKENPMGSREFQELLRATVVTATIGLTLYSMYDNLKNKKDRSFIEQLAFKSVNDAFSLIGALDPSLWTKVRLLGFADNLTTSVSNIVTALATGDRTKEGEIPGLKQLKTTITPVLVKQSIAPTKPESPLKKVYDQVQQLVAEGRSDEAHAIVDGLTDAQYEEYKKVKTSEHAKARAIQVNEMLDTVKQVRKLQKANKEDEAHKIVDALSDADYKIYQSASKMLPLDSAKTPEFTPNEAVPDKGLIHSVVTYATAIGSDPATAFNRIFTGQIIRRVDNGAIIVERMSLADSRAESKKQAGQSNTSGFRLDHTIPLELGGSNSESNLKLVPESQWASYTNTENTLGKALRAGKINKKQAQDLITRFKNGEITADEVKNSI